MFYISQNESHDRWKYEQMLKLIASLSRMFSENDKPYLDSRITENLFCEYLHAVNLARGDVTADAKKGNIGIGIKTWVGSNSQKIAEFDAERKNYEILDTLEEKIKYIAMLRNDRIDMTMRTNALDRMVYHCTIRSERKISIRECSLVPIDIESIRDVKGNEKSFTFTDSKNRYSFNYAKSTLYKLFDDLETVKEIDVEILDNPFERLSELFYKSSARIISNKGIIVEACSVDEEPESVLETRCYLPLYSENKKSGKYVPPKNNLNMRFASGRKRDIYEIGIPIPTSFIRVNPNFFPPKDVSFNLELPDGSVLSAKRCQGDYGKSLMSNPNKALGHWLIDTVLKIDPEVVITYDMLAKYGIDSVEITKVIDEKNNKETYKIAFALCGSYERYVGSVDDDEYENEIDN